MKDDRRNPFGVADAPDPDADDVLAFASTVALEGGPDVQLAELAGVWASRWNGGADPTISGDTPERWKPGRATLAAHNDRIYVLFEWDDGRRQGLLEAIRSGARWHGRYLNLSDPSIARPWAGVIVSRDRIDGAWTNGRLDFHR